ncbi:MAG: hypothetical protein OFPI_17040 [Osedax symbiont Rs2]|nr:MAG: hypothetical protein OFPI_17040 [Osedax symbiont Rs2]
MQITAVEKKIEQVASYIEQNAQHKVSLEQLAEKFDISAFHLQRTFSQQYGLSPRQMQNLFRIQKLKKSLKLGDDISGAIYQAGYGSMSRVYEQLNSNLGMTPGLYKQGAQDLQISVALCSTGYGYVLMAATDRGVCFVHIGASRLKLITALQQEFPNALYSIAATDESSQLGDWMTLLERYLAAQAEMPKLPLDINGTVFQMKVWVFLAQVKQGDKVSYAQVAKAIGQPKAYRAVANACAANKIALLVPCHRVIRGDGSSGGYRWGEDLKRQLLQLEG